jgi:cation diffusion facilitator family transporter
MKHFIKDRENSDDLKVREAYGKLAGVVGIVTNALLCLLKGSLGYLSGSIAIMADAINNLSDAASSVVTLIGFKLAARGGDKEHPYGHARIEYMTGIFVSARRILVGFRLLTSSYEKVLHPQPVEFSYWTMGLLILAILLKVWQSLFNYALAKSIKSATLKATGADSRNDVIATTAVLIALFVGKLTQVNVDGYMGLAVAVFILYSGVQLIRETSQPLLGRAPDEELVRKVQELIMKGPGVLGVHDLIIHDYGPGRVFASVHIEVDAAEDVMKSHETIDDIEREAMKKLHIELVGHLDPVDTADPLVFELRNHLHEILKDIEGAIGLHDLRIVRGEKHTNVIFDVVLSAEGTAAREAVRERLTQELTAIDPKLKAVVDFDTDYSETD